MAVVLVVGAALAGATGSAGLQPVASAAAKAGNAVAEPSLGTVTITDSGSWTINQTSGPGAIFGYIETASSTYQYRATETIRIPACAVSRPGTRGCLATAADHSSPPAVVVGSPTLTASGSATSTLTPNSPPSDAIPCNGQVQALPVSIGSNPVAVNAPIQVHFALHQMWVYVAPPASWMTISGETPPGVTPATECPPLGSHPLLQWNYEPVTDLNKALPKTFTYGPASPLPQGESETGSSTITIKGGCSSAGTPATSSSCGDYVALGDSYSAGEGAGDYLPGTGSGNGGCDRSTNAYPERLANALGYSDKPDALHPFIFAACSGAKTSALFSPFKGQPPQLDHLTAVDRLVTISIGGNDIGFAPVLKFCLRHKDCEHQEEHIVADDLQAAEGNILDAFQAIQRQAPNAKVVVVGYPNFLPATGACHPSAGVLHYLIGLSAADVEFIHRGIEQLDAEIQSLTAGRQGFVFVRPSVSVWSRHTICEPKSKSWFVPVALDDVVTGHSVTFFHPTARGQEELEKEVLPSAG